MLYDVTRKLAVPLTDAEVTERIREARALHLSNEGLRERADELKKQAKKLETDIEHNDHESKRLVRVADAREEERSVKCRWSYDLAANTATLTRLDTDEPVEVRAITSEERKELEQRPLFEGEKVRKFPGGRRGKGADDEKPDA